MDDWELLQRFAQQDSQEAFTEIVHRHLNFVYSCARRQVRSPDIAEEVAQTVFLELARQAARLKPGPPLAAWLHLVTRRAALNTLRGEMRRRAREHAAYESSAMNPSLWEKLEPLLDEALETLHPRDRSAVLLRYFENKPLREVGAALGASEDAAQKRVTRALEDLRRFFARHGIIISVVALAEHLSTQSVEAAPAGLGSLISGKTASAARSLASNAGPAAVVSTLQTSVVVGTLVVIGAAVYEIQAGGVERQRLSGLQRDVAALAARERVVRQERDAAQNRVASLRTEVDRQTAATAVVHDSAIAKLVSRANRLKQTLEANPTLGIPELPLLAEGDWLDVAREREIEAESDLRASLARIRGTAKSKLATLMIRALSAYVRANDGKLPAMTGELQPHIAGSIDPTVLGAMLARYEIKAQGSIAHVPDKAVLILERGSALIDPDYDIQIRVSRIVSAQDTDPLKINTASNAVVGRLAPARPMYLR